MKFVRYSSAVEIKELFFVKSSLAIFIQNIVSPSKGRIFIGHFKAVKAPLIFIIDYTLGGGGHGMGHNKANEALINIPLLSLQYSLPCSLVTASST